MSTTMADNGSDFDPQQAATLLNQARQRAQREFEPYPPWQLATRAAMGLIGYGALWLTTRGQHPYMYPTAAAAPAGILVGAINVAVVTVAAKRANAGVSGRSRLRPAEIAVITTVMAVVFAVMGVLAGLGVSDSIVWGIYPAAVPLIAGGLTWAGVMVARDNRRVAGSSLAIAAVGVAATFAGPSGAWLVAAVGVSAVMLVSAAIVARQHRAWR
jgi:hypothetical protein